ncbi:MAG: glycosyltransferase family 4 protein [Deltaproteobacteria bacterium]|nr:glycosyltransferase family 4 protein [Deltaproteobacteria bacterium]
MEAVRILYLIDNLQFGGGERVFSQIINGLDTNRYKILLASLPDEPFNKSITNKHVKHLPLDFSKRVNPRLSFQIKKIIQTNGIQIVHGQGTRAEFYARIAHGLAGNSKYVSTIAMPVEGFDIGGARKKIYRFFDGISEKFVDQFIVVSDYLKNKMINERGIDPDKVVRIYNGIELKHYSPDKAKESRSIIRKKLKIDDNTYIIGAIGRLVWQKGFEYLIRGIPDVVKISHRVKFLIVGDGPLTNTLKEHVVRLKVDDHLIFSCFRNDIKDILAAIDILAIPSLLEGFPMITLEGMAMAKPIVASRIHGISEQIDDNINGILIPPKDTNALACSIIQLLKDKNKRVRLGEQARKKVQEKFSIDQMITETEKVYQSLI